VIDTAGATAELVKQGVLGIMVVFLLVTVGFLYRQVSTITNDRINDLKNVISAVQTSIAAATEAMKMNTSIQDRAGASAAGLGEAIRLMQRELEQCSEKLDQLQITVRDLERGRK